jgi:hypothetical protein
MDREGTVQRWLSEGTSVGKSASISKIEPAVRITERDH